MAQVGTLTVDLIAQTASFNANIEKAAKTLNSSASRMNRSLDSVKKNIAAMRAEAEGLALGMAIRSAGEFVKRNLDMVGSLGEVAQQLGVTTRELQAYRAIGGQVGVSQEEMDTGLQKLTMTIGKASVGAKAQNDAFSALGVSVRDSSGHVKATGAILEEMADKIAKIPDPAQRAAVEVALFGRAGQRLDTILTGGKRGIEEYTKRAEDMGMILSDDLVSAADAASDKMTELNAQLTANISQAVAQNANSILGLASAIQGLTVSAINFISQYPRLSAALAGAAVGARFGPYGAAAGGLGGLLVGNKMANDRDNANMDLNFRRERLDNARQEFDRVRKAAGGPGYYQNAMKVLQRETALTKQAIAEAKKPKGPALPTLPVVDLPNFLAPEGGKGRKPKAAKDPLKDAAERYGIEMSRIGEDILRIKRDNLTDIDAIAKIDKELLAKQIATEALAIDKDVKDKHITEAQGEQLKFANAIAAAMKAEQIDREAAADHLRENLATALAANDNERDILQAQESIATTTDERRTLQMALLDLDKQAERLKLQEVIDLAAKGKATAEEAKRAQDRLKNLDVIYGTRAEAVRQQNLSPLDQYLKDNDPKLIGDKVERYMVDELEYIQNSLSEAITSKLGIKDPFLAGIIDLFIQTNFIQPLARALQQAQGSGGGGFLGSIFGGLGTALFGGGGFDAAGAIAGGQSALASIPISVPFAGFAAGTTNASPGLHWVGEEGPELLKFRGGEQVIPNHMLKARNDNGAARPFVFNNYAKMTEREARETEAQFRRAYRQEQARDARMGA